MEKIRKKTEEDDGHAYNWEPTHSETSDGMESRRLCQESEKTNGIFLHSLETQALEGMAELEESSIWRVREAERLLLKLFSAARSPKGWQSPHCLCAVPPCAKQNLPIGISLVKCEDHTDPSQRATGLSDLAIFCIVFCKRKAHPCFCLM